MSICNVLSIMPQKSPKCSIIVKYLMFMNFYHHGSINSTYYHNFICVGNNC